MLTVPTHLTGLTVIIISNVVFTVLDVRCNPKTLLGTENGMSFRSLNGGMVCVHLDVHLDHIPSNSSLQTVLPSFITSSLFPSPHCSRSHDPFPNSHGLRLPCMMQTSLIILSLFSLFSFYLWVWWVSSHRIRDNPRIVFAVLSSIRSSPLRRHRMYMLVYCRRSSACRRGSARVDLGT